MIGPTLMPRVEPSACSRAPERGRLGVVVDERRGCGAAGQAGARALQEPADRQHSKGVRGARDEQCGDHDARCDEHGALTADAIGQSADAQHHDHHTERITGEGDTGAERTDVPQVVVQRVEGVGAKLANIAATSRLVAPTTHDHGPHRRGHGRAAFDQVEAEAVDGVDAESAGGPAVLHHLAYAGGRAVRAVSQQGSDLVERGEGDRRGHPGDRFVGTRRLRRAGPADLEPGVARPGPRKSVIGSSSPGSRWSSRSICSPPNSPVR